MFTIKRAVSRFDFIREFDEVSEIYFANNFSALSIIYDTLTDLYGEVEYFKIKDYIRFIVNEMDTSEFWRSYSHLLPEAERKNDNKHEQIEKILLEHTYYLGFYDYDGKRFYLFDEF